MNSEPDSRLNRIGLGRLSVLLGAVGFLIRVLFVGIIYPMTPGAHPNEIAAPDGYTAIAVNLLDGRGYVRHVAFGPELQRPPAYPAVNWFVYRVFGRSQFAMQVCNSLLGGVAVALVTLLSGFAAGLPVAFWTGVIASVLPVQVYYTVLLARENLSVLLLTALTLLAWRAVAEPRTRRAGLLAALTGVAGGLATLTNAIWIFMAPIMTLGAAITRRQQRRRAVWILAEVILLQASVIAPWSIRNYHVTGRFLPISTSGPFTLWMGTCCLRQSYPDCLREASLLIHRSTRNIRPEDDDIFMEGAIRAIRRQPARWLASSLLNGARIWYQNDDRRKEPLTLAMQIPFLALALAGLLLCHRSERPLASYALLGLICVVSLHMAFLATSRYSTNAAPFIGILGGLGMTRLLGRRRSQRQRRSNTRS